MRHRSLPLLAVVATVAAVAASCSTDQPTDLPTADASAVAAIDQTTPSAPLLDLGTPENATGGEGGAGVVATSPSSTVPSSASTGLAGPAPTVPTTRPPAAPPTTIATTALPTTGPTTLPPPPSTGPTTTDRPDRPADGLVEFRISPGTGDGPWNGVEDPVRVLVGQTLRIHNDDSVAHTAHSNGAPFAHGPSIPPGGFADHPIVEPLRPDQGTPVNYDHDAGVRAAFWVVSTPGGDGSNDGGGSTGGDGSGDPAGSTDLVAAEAESLRLLNDLRAGLGLQLVRPTDDEMHAFARQWSLEMRTTGFRHSNPPRWFENIVWYSDETMTPSEAAAQFHDMWINSSGHYRNMTNPDWSVVGVGMWHDETGWWGVHVFR